MKLGDLKPLALVENLFKSAIKLGEDYFRTVLHIMKKFKLDNNKPVSLLKSHVFLLISCLILYMCKFLIDPASASSQVLIEKITGSYNSGSVFVMLVLTCLLISIISFSLEFYCTGKSIERNIAKYKSILLYLTGMSYLICSFFLIFLKPMTKWTNEAYESTNVLMIQVWEVIASINVSLSFLIGPLIASLWIFRIMHKDLIESSNPKEHKKSYAESLAILCGVLLMSMLNVIVIISK